MKYILILLLLASCSKSKEPCWECTVKYGARTEIVQGCGDQPVTFKDQNGNTASSWRCEGR